MYDSDQSAWSQHVPHPSLFQRLNWNIPDSLHLNSFPLVVCMHAQVQSSCASAPESLLVWMTRVYYCNNDDESMLSRSLTVDSVDIRARPTDRASLSHHKNVGALIFTWYVVWTLSGQHKQTPNCWWWYSLYVSRPSLLVQWKLLLVSKQRRSLARRTVSLSLETSALCSRRPDIVTLPGFRRVQNPWPSCERRLSDWWDWRASQILPSFHSPTPKPWKHREHSGNCLQAEMLQLMLALKCNTTLVYA